VAHEGDSWIVEGIPADVTSLSFVAREREDGPLRWSRPVRVVDGGRVDLEWSGESAVVRLGVTAGSLPRNDWAYGSTFEVRWGELPVARATYGGPETRIEVPADCALELATLDWVHGDRLGLPAAVPFRTAARETVEVRVELPLGHDLHVVPSPDDPDAWVWGQLRMWRIEGESAEPWTTQWPGDFAADTPIPTSRGRYLIALVSRGFGVKEIDVVSETRTAQAPMGREGVRTRLAFAEKTRRPDLRLERADAARPHEAAWWCGESDDQGRVELPLLPAGRYHFFVGGWYREIRLGGGPTPDLTLPAFPERSLSTSAMVTVTVGHPGTARHLGAWVVLEDLDHPGSWARTAYANGAIPGRRDTTASFAGVPRGSWRARIVDTWWWPYPTTGAAVEVRIDDDEPRRIGMVEIAAHPSVRLDPAPRSLPASSSGR